MFRHITRTRPRPIFSWLGVLLISALACGCSDGNRGNADRQGETESGADAVLELPVSFTVTNRNTAQPPCVTDGMEYELRAQLIGPAAVLAADAPAVTLYTHGFVFGISGWRYTGIPGYDFPLEMARLGHVSVVYDKLGYGDSGLPDGIMTCIGADTDMADQIVAQLKSGEYLADGAPGPRFAKVALAGISAGGAVAEIAAYTYKSVDALVVMSWADMGNSPAITASLALEAGSVCLQGGEPKSDGGPPRYAYFGRETPEIFFHDYEPQVLEYVRQQQERDPCGSLAQAPVAGQNNRRNVASIAVPVLVVMGQNDALYAPGTAAQQAALFTGSSDVVAIELPNTGHALRGERSVPVFRALLSTWLRERGF